MYIHTYTYIYVLKKDYETLSISLLIQSCLVTPGSDKNALKNNNEHIYAYI